MDVSRRKYTEGEAVSCFKKNRKENWGKTDFTFNRENFAFPYWHDQQNLPLRVNKENANEGKPVFVFIGKRCSAVECTI